MYVLVIQVMNVRKERECSAVKMTIATCCNLYIQHIMILAVSIIFLFEQKHTDTMTKID